MWEMGIACSIEWSFLKHLFGVLGGFLLYEIPGGLDPSQITSCLEVGDVPFTICKKRKARLWACMIRFCSIIQKGICISFGF